MKRKFIKKKKSRSFWEEEYKKGHHLAMSVNPSEDMVKFTKWLEKNYGRKYLNPVTSVLDLGCGNGRNLIHLSKTYNIRGIGYDKSTQAISQAKKASNGLCLLYEARSIVGSISLEDSSQTIVLDMMTSHYLNKEEREYLMSEVSRVLKPGGWLFWKTFLLDGDKHAERLLKEYPGKEEGSYIHPAIGLSEHIFTEDEIDEALTENFTIYKKVKSHRHTVGKRRSISVYAQRN